MYSKYQSDFVDNLKESMKDFFRKKKNLITFLLLVIFSLLMMALSSCSDLKEVTGIKVIGSENQTCEIGMFDYSSYKIIVSYSDGSDVEINLEDKYIPEIEKLKLYNEGEQELKIVVSTKNEAFSDTIKVTVVRRQFDLSLEDLTVEYDGNKHGLEIKGELPYNAEVNFTTGNSYINVGTYNIQCVVYCEYYETITLPGKNEYSKLTITPKKYTEEEKGAVTFSNKNVTYNGEDYSIKIDGTLPQGVSCTYSLRKVEDANGNKLSEDVIPLCNTAREAGKYEITATFDSTTAGINYESYSSPKVAYLTINRAGLDLSYVFNGNTFEYDGDEKSISISGNIPQDKVNVYYMISKNGKDYLYGNSAIDAGEYTVKAQFSYKISFEDRDNYLPIEEKEAKLIISKKELYGGDEYFDNQQYTYNGQSFFVGVGNIGKEITAVKYIISKDGGEPVEFDVERKNFGKELEVVNYIKDAGTYSVIAELEYKYDRVNYICPSYTSTIVVERANLPLFTFDDNTYTYNGEIQSPYYIETLPDDLESTYSYVTVDGEVESPVAPSINAGIYKVIVTFKEINGLQHNYVVPSDISKNYTINKANLSLDTSSYISIYGEDTNSDNVLDYKYLKYNEIPSYLKASCLINNEIVEKDTNNRYTIGNIPGQYNYQIAFEFNELNEDYVFYSTNYLLPSSITGIEYLKKKIQLEYETNLGEFNNKYIYAKVTNIPCQITDIDIFDENDNRVRFASTSWKRRSDGSEYKETEFTAGYYAGLYNFKIKFASDNVKFYNMYILTTDDEGYYIESDNPEDAATIFTFTINKKSVNLSYDKNLGEFNYDKKSICIGGFPYSSYASLGAVYANVGGSWVNYDIGNTGSGTVAYDSGTYLFWKDVNTSKLFVVLDIGRDYYIGKGIEYKCNYSFGGTYSYKIKIQYSTDEEFINQNYDMPENNEFIIDGVTIGAKDIEITYEKNIGKFGVCSPLYIRNLPNTSVYMENSSSGEPAAFDINWTKYGYNPINRASILNSSEVIKDPNDSSKSIMVFTWRSLQENLVPSVYKFTIELYLNPCIISSLRVLNSGTEVIPSFDNSLVGESYIYQCNIEFNVEKGDFIYTDSSDEKGNIGAYSGSAIKNHLTLTSGIYSYTNTVKVIDLSTNSEIKYEKTKGDIDIYVGTPKDSDNQVTRPGTYCYRVQVTSNNTRYNNYSKDFTFTVLPFEVTIDYTENAGYYNGTSNMTSEISFTPSAQVNEVTIKQNGKVISSGDIESIDLDLNKISLKVRNYFDQNGESVEDTIIAQVGTYKYLISFTYLDCDGNLQQSDEYEIKLKILAQKVIFTYDRMETVYENGANTYYCIYDVFGTSIQIRGVPSDLNLYLKLGDTWYVLGQPFYKIGDDYYYYSMYLPFGSSIEVTEAVDTSGKYKIIVDL